MPAARAVMSLVSNPCRYDARSAPLTTSRPRLERSIIAADWRAAWYTFAETMVLRWRYGLVSFYPPRGPRRRERHDRRWTSEPAEDGVVKLSLVPAWRASWK